MIIAKCNETSLCVDCKKKCTHAGDKVADCPRYPHNCELRKLIDSCDECKWIDQYIEEVRTSNG